MNKLTWLGKCREQELDILIIFDIHSKDYFEPPTGFFEEEHRLRQDLQQKYTTLNNILHNDSYQVYPQPFQLIAYDLSQKLEHTYQLLTNPIHYKAPHSNGDRINPFHGECTLQEYVLTLKLTRQPNIPTYAYTLNQFLTLKTAFDDYTHTLEKQLHKKDNKIHKLEHENHKLKQLLTAIEGYIQAIE